MIAEQPTSRGLRPFLLPCLLSSRTGRLPESRLLCPALTVHDGGVDGQMAACVIEKTRCVGIAAIQIGACDSKSTLDVGAATSSVDQQVITESLLPIIATLQQRNFRRMVLGAETRL